MPLGILIIMIYFTHSAASSGPELVVMQYPEDASVLVNSTVWMLCVFEYPREEDEEPVVYWRKGPDFHNQQNLQSSPGTGGPQVHITKNILRGFSILKLSNIDQNASNSYFCDVMLTQKTQGKRGNGTKLTVHDFRCKDCIRSDEIWWSWFLLLGYTIFVTTVIVTYGNKPWSATAVKVAICSLNRLTTHVAVDYLQQIHQCCTKCKNESRNTDSSATLQSEWIYEQPPRPVNNGFNQEYEDMSIIRTLTDTGRKMI